MRKIKTSEGIDLIILPEDRFSLFNIEDNPLRIDRKTQDRIFFHEQCCLVFLPCSNWKSSVYNSGQRELGISVNSEEEKYFLMGYFSSHGFRILREREILGKRGSKRRLYINPEVLEVNSYYLTNELLGLHTTFTIRVNKGEYKKFIKCLKELSRKFNYKTGYQDRNDFKKIIIK